MSINFLLQVKATYNKIGQIVEVPMLAPSKAFRTRTYEEEEFYEKYASLLLTDEDPKWRKRAEDFLTTNEQKQLKLQEYYEDVYYLAYADDDHVLLDSNGKDIFDEEYITDYLLHKEGTLPEEGLFTVIKSYYHIEQLQIFGVGAEDASYMEEEIKIRSSEIYQDLIDLIKKGNIFSNKDSGRAEYADYSFLSTTIDRYLEKGSDTATIVVKGTAEFFDEDAQIFLEGIVNINTISVK